MPALASLPRHAPVAALALLSACAATHPAGSDGGADAVAPAADAGPSEPDAAPIGGCSVRTIEIDSVVEALALPAPDRLVTIEPGESGLRLRVRDAGGALRHERAVSGPIHGRPALLVHGEHLVVVTHADITVIDFDGADVGEPIVLGADTLLAHPAIHGDHVYVLAGRSEAPSLYAVGLHDRAGATEIATLTATSPLGGQWVLAAGPDGLLVLESGRLFDPFTAPRVIALRIAEDGSYETRFDRRWDDADPIVGDATPDPVSGGWIVLTAVNIDGSRTHVSRILRLAADGATGASIAYGTVTTYEGVHASVLVTDDGDVLASLGSPFNASDVYVARAGAALSDIAVEELGASSYRTRTRLVRTYDGCHALAYGVDAMGTYQETRTVIRTGL